MATVGTYEEAVSYERGTPILRHIITPKAIRNPKDTAVAEAEEKDATEAKVKADAEANARVDADKAVADKSVAYQAVAEATSKAEAVAMEKAVAEPFKSFPLRPEAVGAGVLRRRPRMALRWGGGALVVTRTR